MQMSTCYRIALVLGLSALLATPALAQRQRGQGGLGGLLLNESVQKELRIEAEQAGKVKEAVQQVQEKHKDDFDKLRDLPQEERRAKSRELSRTVSEETLKAVSVILKPEQVKRLKQIELQQDGTQAFSRPEVEKALGLKDDQKEKLKAIAEEYSRERRELTQGGNAEANREKIAALRKQTQERVQGVLTDDQKKSWKELTGDPFEVVRRRPDN
jgi:hypothetical protein